MMMKRLQSGFGETGKKMMNNESVRHAAYLIWEMEGRPDGRAEHHWKMAEEKVQGGDQTEKTTSGIAKSIRSRKAAEPALAAETKPVKASKHVSNKNTGKTTTAEKTAFKES